MQHTSSILLFLSWHTHQHILGTAAMRFLYHRCCALLQVLLSHACLFSRMSALPMSTQPR
jgi:hypothetical protein